MEVSLVSERMWTWKASEAMRTWALIFHKAGDGLTCCATLFMTPHGELKTPGFWGLWKWYEAETDLSLLHFSETRKRSLNLDSLREKFAEEPVYQFPGE